MAVFLLLIFNFQQSIDFRIPEISGQTNSEFLILLTLVTVSTKVHGYLRYEFITAPIKPDYIQNWINRSIGIENWKDRTPVLLE